MLESHRRHANLLQTTAVSKVNLGLPDSCGVCVDVLNWTVGDHRWHNSGVVLCPTDGAVQDRDDALETSQWVVTSVVDSPKLFPVWMT
jgi:hypothetical protein